jgi:RNA polymerase sigma-70 factor (TIGR02960 family)
LVLITIFAITVLLASVACVASVEAVTATRTERRIPRRPDVITWYAGRRKSLWEDAPVTSTTLADARAGDEYAFRALTEPYRRELQLHIYRIVGSAQEAEDLLQETLLAAWTGLNTFEGRASVRAWLYRIATNRSLDALRAHGRRPEQQRMRQFPEPSRWNEPLLIEPYPDSLLDGVPDQAPGPEARYETKEAVALAFIVGLQHLPHQQRAVLVLRDVLGYRAAEVADMLATSPASVNSLLSRARAAFESRLPASSRDARHCPTPGWNETSSVVSPTRSRPVTWTRWSPS